MNIFILARRHEKESVLKKRDFFQVKSFLILYLKTILYCLQLQWLIEMFCLQKGKLKCFTVLLEKVFFFFLNQTSYFLWRHF